MKPREREVLDLLCTGLCTKEIEGVLGLQRQTAEKRLARARRRHNCRTNYQLLARYIKGSL